MSRCLSAVSLEEVTTTLPKTHLSGHREHTKVKDNQRTLGKEIGKRNGETGFRYTWRKMEAAKQSRVDTSGQCPQGRSQLNSQWVMWS